MSWSDRVKSAASKLEVKKHRVTLEVVEDLASAMRQRQLNASQFAAQIGKSRAWLSKLFHGGRNLTFFTVIELADALECDVEVRIVPRARETVFRDDLKLPRNVVSFAPRTRGREEFKRWEQRAA